MIHPGHGQNHGHLAIGHAGPGRRNGRPAAA
jgi:hypothetical protein